MFIVSAYSHPLFPATFVETLSCIHWITFYPLPRFIWLYFCGLFILFCWFLCLSLCQYHTAFFNISLDWEVGRSLGEGSSNPLQYSCLENPMDREAWQTAVQRVTERVGHDWATKHIRSVGFRFLFLLASFQQKGVLILKSSHFCGFLKNIALPKVMKIYFCNFFWAFHNFSS